MKSIPSAINVLKRPTWKPQVGDGDGTPFDSKFAGIPWLGKAEPWPACQNCGEPVPLFLQLDLDTLPEALRGEFGRGLLQLFYCTNSDAGCECECETFFPFTPGKLVRIVEPDAEPQLIANPDVAQIFPPKRIIGWQASDDYPNWEEGAEYGVELSDDEWESLADSGFPLSGDKLAGWPHWIQSIEYPRCPMCHERMRFVFQLDSNDHLPYMFGDLGCGHITQCPTHKTQVTFAWACS